MTKLMPRKDDVLKIVERTNASMLTYFTSVDLLVQIHITDKAAKYVRIEVIQPELPTDTGSTPRAVLFESEPIQVRREEGWGANMALDSLHGLVFHIMAISKVHERVHGRISLVTDREALRDRVLIKLAELLP